MQEMKYFNEGNDCDICKNQLMTGRDGTVEDCRRRQNGLSCRFEERDIRTCPVCEHEVDREDMYFTKDCHGIPFRLVCDRCYQRKFIRIAMQQGKLPIGTAVQMSSIWTYHISEKLLADYSGKDIQAELERIRGKRGT